MDRKDFEAVIKRAAELSNERHDAVFAEDDVVAAAGEIGIAEEDARRAFAEHQEDKVREATAAKGRSARRFVVVGLALGLLAVMPVVYLATAGGGPSFTGRYQTNWGTLTLTQDGSAVSGTYAYEDAGETRKGTLIGLARGRTFEFSWTEQLSDGTNGRGEGRLTLAGDGKSFTGTWSTGARAGGSWSGTRASD